MAEIISMAGALARMASQQPSAPAMHVPRGAAGSGEATYSTIDYQTLDADVLRIARGLVGVGIAPGERVAVLLRPSPELFAVVFARFRAGIAPIVVDPGMGLRALGACLDEAAPVGMIAAADGHLASLVLGWARRTLRVRVTVGRRWLWGGVTLTQVRALGDAASGRELAPVRVDDVAAVAFTSGSTGLAKGVVYTHGNFAAQVDMLRSTFGIVPGEIDLPTFPLFALFDPALGMTTVLPRMDFTRPASVLPEEIVRPIHRFSATNMFGSPALLDRVARIEGPRGVKLPSLRRVISAGAPVKASVLDRFVPMLVDGALVATPYGATEALPVAVIDHHEILGETRARTDDGAGVCIGRPVGEVRVEVIRLDDAPIERWSDSLRVLDGEVGEFVVASPSVTREYLGRQEATRLAKIAGPHGEVMHRMGDVGFRDEAGRLWYCGRKSHRVRAPWGVLFTEQVEALFDRHEAVRRCALVGIARADGAEDPVVVVEPEPDRTLGDDELVAALRALAEKHTKTRGIERFLVHRRPLPVDVRHNAKIFREKLAVWATEQSA